MRIRTVVVASLVTVACAAALVLACGGTTDAPAAPGDASPGSDGSLTGNDAGNDAGTTGDGAGTTGDGASDAPSDAPMNEGGLSPACPAVAPSQGDACALGGLECEYGTSPLRICNTIAKCTSAAWSVTVPEAACANELDAGGVCPPALGDIEAGSPCPTFRQICEYPQGACGCGFVGHISDQWVCDTPSGAGCPSPRPKLGSICTPNGLACDYGSCSILGNPKMSCDGGIWSEVLVACPP